MSTKQPVAWMYEHNAVVHDKTCPPIVTTERWTKCRGPYTETPLYRTVSTAAPALQVLRDELAESIDGGEECRGRDTQITRWINLADLALGKSIEPWAKMALEPDLDAAKETK